jgi:hypothetical protein
MQEMQEQFFVMSKDGLYAGNAGAIFCYVQKWIVCRKRRSNFLLCPRMDCMQEMQEQFSVYPKVLQSLPLPPHAPYLRPCRQGASQQMA